MTTTLSLYDATGILDGLMKTRDATTCAVCDDTLVDECYVICKSPETDPGTRGLPKEHKAHTACKKCVDDLAYIGDGAACLPCLTALGGRRSSIKLAGVALRPAVRNGLADHMLRGFMDAEHTMEEARDREKKSLVM